MTYSLNADHYPSTEQGLMALVEAPREEPVPTNWIKLADRAPTDPWGNEYQYRLHSEFEPPKPEVWSMGEDGIPGNRDDLSSLDSE